MEFLPSCCVPLLVQQLGTVTASDKIGHYQMQIKKKPARELFDVQSNDPTPGQQEAFSEAHDLYKRLEAEGRVSLAEVGTGLLIAAVVVLRKAVGNKATAELLYEYADDYACRDQPR
ncbi:hypothetical protein [Leisingera sp. ANG-DT]|uniref:hypothetical protein n=1 Tax=Leisingera sp. ANG-DT TaxID=1577897 RepID=UPI001269B20F|nr:hypothetical protein [Leisingera sp. ANG-DT]